MATTVAAKVPFEDLCKVCEIIGGPVRGDKKRKVLRTFISTWRDFHAKLYHGNPNTTDSFHPAMRLLVPQLDKERGPYGIKESMLAKLYIDILNLNKESSDAQKLLNYRIPTSAKRDATDFASVAYFVLKNRCPASGTLTIHDVNEDLDGIALSYAEKKKDVISRHLLHLLRNTTAMEQKWLIRIIVKELKFGLSETSVLNAFHPDAKDLYDVTNSLIKVCTQLKDPNVRLHEIEVSLFAPFRPMLAESSTPDKVEKLMRNGQYYIETKYDGERMQLHRKGAEFRYFSRGGNEYTASFGPDADNGNLTPHIASAFDSKALEFIIDGEMVGYRKDTKYIATKGENFDVKALHPDGIYQPCYCVFDILQYNGKVLSNKPLSERLQCLDTLFVPVEGRLHQATRREGHTKQDAVDALNRAIDSFEEGVIIKDPTSVYRPNVRRGGWLKIKPEYVDELMDHLSLLIVGGYFGEGYRRGMTSHFLLALAVPPENKTDHPTVFHSVCKVGSGYTKQELFELCGSLNDHWHVYDRRKAPANILTTGSERPDVWIEPSKSKILQIKAAEIIASDQYKVGYTLRFPRVEKIRYDKSWFDCTTTADFEELRKLAGGKLASRHLDAGEEDAGEPPAKKRHHKGAVEQPISVVPHFRGIDPASVTEVSRLLLDKEFCVASGRDAAPSKPELEKIIVGHGGTIVQNPGRNTFCVLADKESVRVRNIVKAGEHDVVKSSWLLKCLDAIGEIVPWIPLDMIHASPATKKNLANAFDKYGDSYLEPTSADALRQLFDSVKPELETLGTKAIAALEMEHFQNDSKNGLFRMCTVYLDVFLLIGDETTRIVASPLELTALDLRFYGATVVAELDENVTHVIVHSRCKDRLEKLKRLRRRRSKVFHLVTEKWVERSLASRSILEELPFAPI